MIGFPAASTAIWAASTFGVWALLPVLPTIWLAIGAALCIACIGTSRLFQPRLSTSRAIPMYSLEFAQWWMVSRLVNVTTYVFADHLRGTLFLTWWYRAMVSTTSPLSLFPHILLGLPLLEGAGMLVHALAMQAELLRRAVNLRRHVQGAHIGEGCHIDTLDVCDFELVTLGDNVVLNEGSSITGHYFQDGHLHFKEVSLYSAPHILCM